MSRTLRLALLSLLLSAAAQAKPYDEQIAKMHFQTGQSYFEARRYEEAVKEFIESYQLSRKVDLLWNIARCYQKLDDPGRMTTYYQKYLAEKPAAPDRVEIEGEIARAAPRVGKLIVHSDVPGSELRVDGELVGLAPIDPVLLTTGKHKIEAGHADYAPATVEVDVPGAQTTEITVTPKDLSVPVVVTKPETSPILLTTQQTEPPRRRWLWPVVGVGAAIVVAAIVFSVLYATRTDFAAQARGSCVDPMHCTLLDGAQ